MMRLFNFNTPLWAAVFLMAYAGGSKAQENPPSPHIVGGLEATNMVDFSYQAEIRKDGGHHCGGTIISKDWILTAAHCMEGCAKKYLIGLGDIARTQTANVHNVIQYINHPSYNKTTTNYDIALIKISPPANFSPTIAILPLVTKSFEVPSGTEATVSGWGDLYSGSTDPFPVNLRYVVVPVVSQEQCRQAYSVEKITDKMLCAGTEAGGKDSCQADSGGPLVATIGGTKQLIGVVSWGTGCALPNVPGVYAKVSDSELRDWITGYTGV